MAANDTPILLAGEETMDALKRAENPGQMWAAIGQDSYVVVPIESTIHPEQELEGTRLTVVSLLTGWVDRGKSVGPRSLYWRSDMQGTLICNWSSLHSSYSCAKQSQ